MSFRKGNHWIIFAQHINHSGWWWTHHFGLLSNKTYFQLIFSNLINPWGSWLYEWIAFGLLKSWYCETFNLHCFSVSYMCQVVFFLWGRRISFSIGAGLCTEDSFFHGRHYGWSVRSSSMIGTKRVGDAAKMPFEKERNMIPSLKLT